MIIDFFLQLPIPIQVIALFSACFVFFVVSFFIDRVIAIRIWGSKEQYFKYSNNHMTNKQIWSSSAVMSLIITVLVLVMILRKEH